MPICVTSIRIVLLKQIVLNAAIQDPLTYGFIERSISFFKGNWGRDLVGLQSGKLSSRWLPYAMGSIILPLWPVFMRGTTVVVRGGGGGGVKVEWRRQWLPNCPFHPDPIQREGRHLPLLRITFFPNSAVDAAVARHRIRMLRDVRDDGWIWKKTESGTKEIISHIEFELIDL